MSDNIDKEIKSVDAFSMDLEKMNKEKLKSVFPECFVEDKLDIDKLLGLCGEYIIEDFEKYRFEWKGKSECLQLAQKRSMGALRPCPEESADFENTNNIYIEGDNLEVLKLLQVAYFNKVKMIYIDPPYNTGHDFVYEDDYSDPLERYKAVTSQATKSNPETMGRFHTKWLNMMYPRLRLAANLLRDDGVIFISIDDAEVHNLRKLCDETFGEENFVAELVWERAYSPKNDAKYISNSHDYVLMYAKHIEAFKIGRLPRTEEANARYSNPDNDPRGDWKSTDMSAKTYNENYDYEITLPSGRVVRPPHGSCWRLSKKSFEEKVKNNQISFGANGDGVPRIKTFLSELKNEGMAPQSLFFYKDVGHSQEGRQELKKIFDDKGYFDNPKPVRLLKRILTIANVKKDDIIVDFFSGSATTAHAVMQLNAEDGGNRHFILVQLPELCNEKSEAYKAGYKNICEIGKERIRRAGKKITEENNQLKLEERETPLDIGFKVFKLDSSNLNEWNSIPINDDLGLFRERLDRMLNKIKPDRSGLDVAYEIILKLGFPLSTIVTETEVSGKKCFIVGEECLILICLEHGLTLEDIEQMAEYRPANLIFSKQSFADSNVLLNAHYRIKDIGIEIKLV